MNNTFMNNLGNNTTTTNEAKAYKSTLSATLDLFSSGVVSQSKNSLFTAAYAENKVIAIKAALYLRDVRNGQGNRDILRAMLANLNADEVNMLLKHLPEVGRWKDVIELLQPRQSAEIIDGVLDLLATNKDDALLCKWLPREKSTHKDKAKLIMEHFGMSAKEYRKHVAEKSSTVEQQMCNGKWHEIEYKAVPSIANIKYAGAFLRNDESRRREFIGKVVNGETTANVGVTYPHDILSLIGGNYRTYNTDKRNTLVQSADAYWSQLPDYMADCETTGNVLPIIDTSGSMTVKVNGDVSALDIAFGLGVYMAERNTGEYKDAFLTFSTNPKFQYIPGNTLSEKLSKVDYNGWSMSTDLDKVMDMILDAASRSPETAPKMIIIVSDMQFNGSVRFTNYERAKAKFRELGLEMPTTVFWQVNAPKVTKPVMCNDKRTMVINGYSPSILKEILTGDMLDYNPEQAMLKILNDKYTFVDEYFTKREKNETKK